MSILNESNSLSLQKGLVHLQHANTATTTTIFCLSLLETAFYFRLIKAKKNPHKFNYDRTDLPPLQKMP